MKLSRCCLFALALGAPLLCLNRAHADDPKKQVAVTAPAADTSKDKPLPAVFSKANPESIDDLKAIERHVKEILTKVQPCTVCVQAGGASGSGVIVTEDGLVLTAGHLSGEPGRSATIVMPDGTRHKGKTLGGSGAIDSGLVQITDKGKWPTVEMGRSADLKKGDWCVVLGHPGGYKTGRSPVLRVGRVLEVNTRVSAQYIRTDCTLVGGDSGGPLFDMHGRVIGIHSRIGGSITANLHVPVDTYRATWDRLVKGERWGNGIGPNVRPTRGEPDLGLRLDLKDNSCRIDEVIKGSTAEKAGLKKGDVIKRFSGREMLSAAGLLEELKKKLSGDEVVIEIQRGTDTLTLKVVLGRKQGA